MKCSSVQKWLSAYVDGKLDFWRQRRVGKHLRNCDECQIALKREQEAVAAVQQLVSHNPEVDARFRARFAARFQELRRREKEETRPVTPVRRWVLAGTLAGVMAVCAIAGVYIVHSRIQPVDEKELLLNLDLYENLDVIINMERMKGG